MKAESYIQELLEGKSVASSKLPGKFMTNCLEEGMLSVSVHGTRKTVRVRDADVFRKFLSDKDERFRITEVEDRTSRASLSSATGNSKLTAIRSCPGFPVNAIECFECRLNGCPIVISPAPGTFTFICDWQTFVIPSDAIVVGVENMENFRNVHLQKDFFRSNINNPEGKSKFLFVSRYPQSSDLRRWLQGIPNRYIHFGDFDLAGIKIFQTEFERYLGKRASFLIPEDIEQRLKSGSSKRYDDQLRYAGGISSETEELQKLIDIINRERKGYDQEGYIKA